MPYISLPNSCYISEIKISPSDLDIKKDWFIHYTFFDPQFAKPLRRQIRGMNNHKTPAARLKAAKKIMALELEDLQNGYNPYRNEIVSSNHFELNPDTPFIAALIRAMEKIKGVKGTLVDMRSVIKGVELSSRQLGIDRMPVKNVTRKYFKMIFEKCYENNPRFSANRQNVYRKTLKRLYDELIEMEAVDFNPLTVIRKEKTVKKERKLPNEEERQIINHYLKNNVYTFWRAIQIFFASGAREIELFRVQAKDVNLADQTCNYLVKKGKEERRVKRPIVDSALHLWEEILEGTKPEDFLFSQNLCTGSLPMKSTDPFGRRWRRHVKIKLGIDVDLYTLKHLNTTELMDRLDKEYNPAKEVQKLTGHKTETMIAKVYDMNFKNRKDDKIKKAGRSF